MRKNSTYKNGNEYHTHFNIFGIVYVFVKDTLRTFAG